MGCSHCAVLCALRGWWHHGRTIHIPASCLGLSVSLLNVQMVSFDMLPHAPLARVICNSSWHIPFFNAVLSDTVFGPGLFRCRPSDEGGNVLQSRNGNSMIFDQLRDCQGLILGSYLEPARERKFAIQQPGSDRLPPSCELAGCRRPRLRNTVFACKYFVGNRWYAEA